MIVNINTQGMSVGKRRNKLAGLLNTVFHWRPTAHMLKTQSCS